MRRIIDVPLWIGHVGDVRDPHSLHASGIRAVVDLAVNEPPAVLPRELVYCRFPLLDGPGNPPWLLRGAVEIVAGLVRAKVPTLVFCGAGMSRSPAVAAAAVALARGGSLADGLRAVTASGPSDVSPGFLSALRAAVWPERGEESAPLKTPPAWGSRREADG